MGVGRPRREEGSRFSGTGLESLSEEETVIVIKMRHDRLGRRRKKKALPEVSRSFCPAFHFFAPASKIPSPEPKLCDFKNPPAGF
jgi:hypothetical protein